MIIIAALFENAKFKFSHDNSQNIFLLLTDLEWKEKLLLLL